MRKYLLLLILVVLLGPEYVIKTWAQGTTALNRILRIAASTPYPLTLPLVSAAAGQTLVTDGSGGLSWQTLRTGDFVSQNLIMFSTDETCPDGWAEYTALRGRYALGLPASGTNVATVGTALTDLEEREVGLHTHVQNSHSHVQDSHTHTQNAHNHTQNAHSHNLANFGNERQMDTGFVTALDDSGTAETSETTATNNAATAVNQSTAAGNNGAVATNQSSGSVAGTNAPFIQLLACRKS